MEWISKIVVKFNETFRKRKVHTIKPEITWEEPPELSYPARLTKAHYQVTCNMEGVFEFEPGPGTALPVGAHELLARFLPIDPEQAPMVKIKQVIVAKAKPNLSWKTPHPICEGTAINSKQLNAACINLAGGEYEYNPPARSKLLIGTHILRCKYNPAHEYSKNYCSAEIQVELVVEPMKVPVILWGGPENKLPDIYYGTPLSTENVLTAAVADYDGRITYEPESGTILQAGPNQSIRATFMPTNRNAIKSVYLDLKLTVLRANPIIDWPPPAPIYAGTVLTSAQLCAANALLPNTHAEYEYSPSLEVELPAGQHVLSVKFTPDPNIVANYAPISAHTHLVVLPKKVPVLVWGVEEGVEALVQQPSYLGGALLQDRGQEEEKGDLEACRKQRRLLSIRYGEEISAENVMNARCTHYLENGVLRTDDAFGGDIHYSVRAGALLEPGTHTITATFVPWNTVEYERIMLPLPLEVLRAQPLIFWEDPADMLKNTALSEVQLNATIAYAPSTSPRIASKLKCFKLGSLNYDPPLGAFLHVGPYDLVVTFVPHEQHAKYYQPCSASVRLEVVRPMPALHWDNPVPELFLGHALTKHQCCAYCVEETPDKTIVTGTFEYSPPLGTKLPLGCHTLTARFKVSPEYAHDYSDTTTTTTVHIHTARLPTLTWEPPADIPYNTPLTHMQLTCKCDVYEGFLLYDPPIGTILEAGITHMLKCTFMPDDEIHWLSATIEVPLRVYKTAPTFTWRPIEEFYSGMRLTAQHLSCSVNEIHLSEGTMTYSPGVGAVLGIGTHVLKANFTVPVGWRHRYGHASMTLTLVVGPKLAPPVTWTNGALLMDWDEIVYGHKLSKKQLNAQADIPGQLVYNPPLGALLDAAEEHVLSCVFTPEDLDKYLITTFTRKLRIKQAIPLIEWTPKLPFMYVGKGDRSDLGLREHTLNACTTTINAADGTLLTGKFIYCPELGARLPVGEHTMTVIFQPSREVAHNYTFGTHYIKFLVIPEGSLFKIPQRYTEPEVRPLYRDPKETILRPPEAGAGDFYFSALDTQIDSDHTRRNLEARAAAAKRQELENAEAALTAHGSRPGTRSEAR